jgi:N-acetylneuraminate synthase
VVIRLGSRLVGGDAPPLIVGEIGVNHLGSIAVAIELARLAHGAGVELVKLQLRTPELSVPEALRGRERMTPWGPLTEEDYRARVELTAADLALFAASCKRFGVMWAASCWDRPALERLVPLEPAIVKIPSARLRDSALVADAARSGLPVMLSTGMSDVEAIRQAVELVGERGTFLAHTVSAYPCPTAELNLASIPYLMREFPASVIGYSGHEVERWPSYVAVALGARFVERHITFSRRLAGHDHRASLQIDELSTFCTALREVRAAIGEEKKELRAIEEAARDRLVT